VLYLPVFDERKGGLMRRLTWPDRHRSISFSAFVLLLHFCGERRVSLRTHPFGRCWDNNAFVSGLLLSACRSRSANASGFCDCKFLRFVKGGCVARGIAAFMWRRGGDLNPRDPSGSTRSPGVRLKPGSATSPHGHASMPSAGRGSPDSPWITASH
jgi:hypothetical protein